MAIVTLNQLQEMAESLTAIVEQIELLERQLKSLKESKRELEEHLLPDMMEEIGLTGVTTKDGRRIELKDEIYANVKKANMAAAERWLKEHGFDGIMKHKVVAEFGPHNDNALETLAEEAAQIAEKVDVQHTIHPQTLKAFVKERLSVGDDIPMDLFGVYRRRVATTTK